MAEPFMNIPAAAVAVGDVIYAGSLETVVGIDYSTPHPGRITFQVKSGTKLPDIGANRKVSVKRA
jgi:hypothetical protein